MGKDIFLAGRFGTLAAREGRGLVKEWLSMELKDRKCTLLIADDTDSNIDILVEAFADEYDVMVATDGPSTLKAVDKVVPDLILLDVMMPGLDGFEVCRRLKKEERFRELPVIFLTAMDQLSSKEEGFRAGGVDYVTKPFDIVEVKARVQTHISLLLARQSLANQNLILEEKVQERTRELNQTQNVTISALASLAETRDNETGWHIKRTRYYIETLINALRDNPDYAELRDPETAELIIKSAPLHDIGKIGVPDSILLKPGPLTQEEFEEMKKHTILGSEALLGAEKELGSSSFLRIAADLCRSHHEKWNGEGYPDGLSGNDIPLVGRLMAIADVYDALISARVYKPPFSHEDATTIILEGKGTHFDPGIVEAFEKVHHVFNQIALDLADEETGRVPHLK